MSKKAKKSVKDMNEKELAIHEALKEKKLAKKQAKRDVLVRILQATIAGPDPELAKLAKGLLPKKLGGVPMFVGGKRQNLATALFNELFAETSVVTEDQVWAKYKLGRAEMKKKALFTLKKGEPEDRRWIAFDADAGTYTLLASGANPPEGWEGYIPEDVA